MSNISPDETDEDHDLTDPDNVLLYNDPQAVTTVRVTEVLPVGDDTVLLERNVDLIADNLVPEFPFKALTDIEYCLVQNRIPGIRFVSNFTEFVATTCTSERIMTPEFTGYVVTTPSFLRASDTYSMVRIYYRCYFEFLNSLTDLGYDDLILNYAANRVAHYTLECIAYRLKIARQYLDASAEIDVEVEIQAPHDGVRLPPVARLFVESIGIFPQFEPNDMLDLLNTDRLKKIRKKTNRTPEGIEKDNKLQTLLMPVITRLFSSINVPLAEPDLTSTSAKVIDPSRDYPDDIVPLDIDLETIKSYFEAVHPEFTETSES